MFEKDSDYESMFGGSSDDEECHSDSISIQGQKNHDIQINRKATVQNEHPPVIDLTSSQSSGNSSSIDVSDERTRKEIINNYKIPRVNKHLSNKKIKECINIECDFNEGSPAPPKCSTSVTRDSVPKKRKYLGNPSTKSSSVTKLVGKLFQKEGTGLSKTSIATKKSVNTDNSIVIDKAKIIERARARLAVKKYSKVNQTKTSKPSKLMINSENPLKKGKQMVKPKYIPEQYTHIEMDYYWRNLRNWNYIDDLIKLLRLQKGMKSKVENNNSVTSSDTINKKSNENVDTLKQALPDCFVSPPQYKALWAPLLLDETKSQMLSEISTMASRLPNMLISVQATHVRWSEESSYSETTTLHISTKTSSNIGNYAIMTEKPCSKTVANNRTEFTNNDLVLLVPDAEVFEKACHGKIIYESSSSLLSYTSPIVKGRYGVIGIVVNRSKTAEGLMVNVSRRLWKTTEPSQVYLLRLNDNITSLREFTALTKVGELPLTKYLLAKTTTNVIHYSLSSDPLSDAAGPNALGLGFRRYVHKKFNISQKGAISAAAREYGVGGFTLVKGPPGTGKTTTLVALLNALHLRQYQRYYSEIERITTSARTSGSSQTLAAIHAAAKVKPRILVCAPSNGAVDNIILKIMEDRFVDGNGGNYSPSIVRVGIGQSHKVATVSLKYQVSTILSEGTSSINLETHVTNSRNELKRLENEIQNLQRRVRVLVNASPYPLSQDWEIRIDEDNFGLTERVLFVNHKEQTVSLTCPHQPLSSENVITTQEMPHYKSCMDTLVNYIERYNTLYSKLEQYLMIQNTAMNIQGNGHSQAATELSQQLETHILDSMHIVMTTLGSAGSKIIASAVKFEVVVVDEAAQSSEPSTLVALQLGSSHAILVGDPQQLPATIFSVSGRYSKYDRSLFQRLEEAGHPVHMLNVQYRMHPAISSFPRRIFYDGSLQDGANVLEKDYGGELMQSVRCNLQFFKPLTIFDLDSVEERGGVSLWNTDEAKFTFYLFMTLHRETHGISTKSRVAIITPYSQQVTLLHKIFKEKYGDSYANIVDISTVDAFQGKEANIVIFSCVRGASNGVGIGFLSDVKRMNVALTRAKHFLFIIARCRTILINPYWRDLVGHARKQQAILKVNINRRKLKADKIDADIDFPVLKNILPLDPGISSNELDFGKGNSDSDSDISA